MPGKRSSRARLRCWSWPTTRSSSGTCDGQITYWNAGAEQTYGFTRAEAMGRISHDLLRTHFPEPVESIEAITTQRGRWDGELTHRCADGRTIIVESRWAAQRGSGGSLLGFLEINRDITARKHAEREIQALNAALEQRVAQRTVHLERANKHLAAFTYSAAHDLRTPLRGMSGFAEALVEEYGDQLDDTGRGYAGRIQAASGQMATVLDAQLNLSRVSRAEMNLQDVDLSAEVTAICGQLRAHDPGRQVQVTVEDGVHAIADPPDPDRAGAAARKRLEVHRRPRRYHHRARHHRGGRRAPVLFRAR